MTTHDQVNELLDMWEDQCDSDSRLSLDEFVAQNMQRIDRVVIKAFRQRVLELAAIDKRLAQVAVVPAGCDLPLNPSTPSAHSTSNGNLFFTTGDLPLSAITPSVSFSLSQIHAGIEPIPGYTLVSRLGCGGFGEVWKAESPGGFHVALKFVQLGGRVGEVEERSLNVMKDVRHPNLLSVFGTWRTGDRLIIATELADCTLLDRLHESQKKGLEGIPKNELFRYMAEAAKGIDALNDPGKSGRMRIQHRDIKPQNLLLSGGSVKVGDFGLARSIQHDVTGHTGSLTFAYAAPECFDGTTSNHTDQYSLAITYCHLRGGRLPFDGTLVEIMEGHRQQPPDLSMLPAEERPAVAKALAKLPNDRWKSCLAFTRALVAASQRKGCDTPVGDQPGDVSTGLFQGYGVLYLTILAAVVMTASVGTYLLSGKPDVPDPKVASGSSGVPEPLGVTINSPASPPEPPATVEPQVDLQLVMQQELAKVIVSKTTGMKLTLIPAGEFLMGSSPTDVANALKADENLKEEYLKAEQPQHRVRITKPFYLGVYEVTQGEYEKVMQGNPAYISASGGGKDKIAGVDTKRLPVEAISWYDAVEFCNTLSVADGLKPYYTLSGIERNDDGSIKSANVAPVSRAASASGASGYRLPSEAQWEYAARAGTTTPFWFGSTNNGKEANIVGNHPFGTQTKGAYVERTTTVGSYRPNPFGLYDTVGNVWEWCEDGYDEGEYATRTGVTSDPLNASAGEYRVLRGGSWGDDAKNTRTAYRNSRAPVLRLNGIGLRVCLANNESFTPPQVPPSNPIQQPPTIETPHAEVDTAEWKLLFDGKSLTNWTGDVGVMTVNNGVLVNVGKRGIVSPPGDFRDVEIEIEFRLQNGGNSGLGICYAGIGDPAEMGLEIQMLDDKGHPGVGDTGQCGAVWKLAATKSGHFLRWPDWNRFRVTTLQDAVKVELNGVLITDTTRSIMKRKNPNHTGLLRTSGKVCLYPHTGRSEYRNFRIRTVNPQR